MSAALIALACFFGLLGGVVAAWWQHRTDTAHLDVVLEQLRDRARRVQVLEAQVDDLHRQGLVVGRVELPEALPAAVPLPERVTTWLAGVEEDDAREEFEQRARYLLAKGMTDHQVIADLESGAL